MNKFEFIFTGESIDGKDFSAKMIITGEAENIGTLLADYAIQEFRNGQAAPAKILAAAYAKIQKESPEGNGRIIKPIFKV